MASPAYSDAWLVMIAIGTAKGMIIIINGYCHQCRGKLSFNIFKRVIKPFLRVRQDTT